MNLIKKSKQKIIFGLILVLVCCALISCASGAKPGPDKQAQGMFNGAVLGAGAGAVTGFQLSAATGPGAAVGAGLGAVAGTISGVVQDGQDEQLMQLRDDTEDQKRIVWAQEVLAEQNARRLALHPTREIYPADLFFCGDESNVKPGAEELIFELARLNKKRRSWSQIIVASYVKAANPENEFAQHLAENRAKAIGNLLVKGGIEARRVQGRSVIMPAPLLIDPNDAPERYSQAIELILIDR